MAKTYILKERGTGATLYPQTIFKQVYGPDGRNLEAVLPDMQEQINSKQPSEPGKGLSANDYTDTDKQSVEQWHGWRGQFTLKGAVHKETGSIFDFNASLYRTPYMPLDREHPITLTSCTMGDHADIAFFDARQELISCVKFAVVGGMSTNTCAAGSYPDNAVYFMASSYGKTGASVVNSPTLEAVQGATAQAIQASKVALFDDMFTQAVGTYGKVDHSHVEDDGVERHYYLNKLWLTYGEAMATYEAGWPHNNAMTAQIYSGAAAKIRTNLPLRISTYRGGFGEFCFANPTIEIVRLSSNTCIFDGNYGFYHCSKLREVIGKIIARVRYICNGCPNLTSITIAIDDGVDLQIQDCPLLNLDSFKYMVDNSKNCSMAVHPDVFAKLTGDTGNAAAAALSPEEMAQWMALPELAAEKNIQIALAEQI